MQVKGGSTFLQCKLNLLHGVPMHPLRTHLNREFRSDLAWWQFAPEWNSVFFLSTAHLPHHQMPLGHGAVVPGVTTTAVAMNVLQC